MRHATNGTADMRDAKPCLRSQATVNQLRKLGGPLRSSLLVDDGSNDFRPHNWLVVGQPEDILEEAEPQARGPLDIDADEERVAAPQRMQIIKRDADGDHVDIALGQGREIDALLLEEDVPCVFEVR